MSLRSRGALMPGPLHQPERRNCLCCTAISSAEEGIAALLSANTSQGGPPIEIKSWRQKVDRCVVCTAIFSAEEKLSASRGRYSDSTNSYSCIKIFITQDMHIQECNPINPLNLNAICYSNTNSRNLLLAPHLPKEQITPLLPYANAVIPTASSSPYPP
jgi:hypothetical protein